MEAPREWWKRLRGTVRRPEMERGLEEEIRFHIDQQTQKNLRAGMPPAEARRAAVLAFGGVERVKEEVREETNLGWAEHLWSDLRYGLRLLRRTPGPGLIAVLTLALGIGATTTVLTLVRSVLLRPLPYADPERVVVVWREAAESDMTWLSRQEVVAYGREVRAFESSGGYTVSAVNLTGDGEPDRVTAAYLSAGTFAALGSTAHSGRLFGAAEDRPGSDGVAVLSWGLWQRRYGGDPAILGREIRVSGVPRTVVGVMPPDFRLPLDYREERPSEILLPLALDPGNLGGWGDRSYFLVGRLRPGVTPGRATAEMTAAARGWMERGDLGKDHLHALERAALPVGELVFGAVRPALLVVSGAVALILLISCANVANLLLARGDGRGREVALRTALGARRRRIVAQLLTESALLALLGGLAGVALAWGGVRALAALDPAAIPRAEEVRPDAAMLALAALLSLLTGVLAGLAPTLQLSRPDPVGALREGGRSATAGRGRHRFRRALVLLETALSVVLLIGAGLLIRSFVEMRRVQLGLDPERVLTARLSLPNADYDSPAAVAFYRDLLDGVERLPGVASAGAARILPLTGTIGDWSITIEGRVRRPEEDPNGDWQVVTPGYFESLGIEVERGRSILPSDDEDAPVVAVINRTMAERYWPGEDALGKRFHLGTLDQPWVTVVGISRPVRHNEVLEEPRAEMYIPHAQFALEGGNAPRSMTLVVKASGDPLALAAPLRSLVRSLDRDLPVTDVRTMEEVVSTAFSRTRFVTLLLGGFAALALLLASIGLYGVISYFVAQRTHEIGIRMALGAGRGAILRQVVGQGVLLTLAGAAAGTVGALFLTRLLASLLYGVTALDPVTFLAVPLLLVLVSLLASYLPARRALSVEPLSALRHQ